MFQRTSSTWTKPFTRVAIAVGVCVAGWVGPQAMAAPIDLNIQDDADYTRFVDAIRATEYFREDYIVENRNPRVVATVAALSAYAQLNPIATQAQLTQFANGFDAAIQSEYAGDPDLRRAANFMSALRFIVIDEPGLEGTNTHVGQLAAQMLNVVVPAPDNFDATQRRMVRFGQGLAMRYTHNRRFADLLVHGFFGIAQDGTERPDLALILNQYLTAQGYQPNLGSTNADPRFTDVNAGLQSLPVDFASYTSTLNQPLAVNALVNMVDVQAEAVQLEIDSRIATLDDAIAAEPTMYDGFAMGQDQAVLDQIAADLQAQLQETSFARSSMFGATFLLGQSPLDELGDYSVAAADYNATLLEASDTVAEVQMGLGILTNLTTVAAGYASGDPIAAMGGVFGLVSDAIGIADHAGAFDNTPSVDEQIYAQLIELRIQIETMRIEMHERFDRIEQQLNFMYDQMLVGFNAIGNAIGDLQGQNNAILREMHVVRSQLSQLESALFGVAEDILLTDLTDAANTVLDYRDENNIDLEYANQTPNFITASEDFFTFATVTARSQAFSGSRSNPLVTLSTADQYLSANPIARYLNDLAVLPQSLGLAPLTFTTLSGPEPWAQSASAYAQLAKENPWYFAFRYESQLEDYLSDPQNESLPELDEIIEDGEALVNIGNAARNPVLFDALVARYKQQTATLQSEINAIMFAEMTSQKLRWSSGENLSMVDLWDTDGIQTNIEPLFTQYSPAHIPAFTQMDGSSDVWGGAVVLFDIDPGLSYFQKARIVSGENTDHAYRAVLFEYLNQLDASPKYAHELRWDTTIHPPLTRGFFFYGAPSFSVIHWIDVNPDSAIVDLQSIHTRNVRSSIDVWGTEFNDYQWFPIDLLWNEESPDDCAYEFMTRGGGRDVAWNTLNTGMPFGGVDGADLQFTNVIINDFNYLENSSCGNNWFVLDDVDILRFRPWRDSVQNVNNSATINGHIFEFLTQYREGNIRPLINADFTNPISAITAAAQDLDNTVALINAYITLAAPDAVAHSEILRSALRAALGQSEIGLRSADVIQLILEFQTLASARDPRSPADPAFDFHVLDQILNQRIDFVHDEINRAIALPLESPPYIEWMLAELNDVRDYVFAPARDDAYQSTGTTIIVDSASGVMANDTLQEYRIITIDPSFGELPTNGSLTLNIDGSFEYTPNPGFSGTDSFTYRLVGTIVEGLPSPEDGQFVSEPATVTVNTQTVGCSLADTNADGVINFFDISTFLQAFTAQDLAADFNNDGLLNFFDISTFLQIFAMGCP